MEALTPFPISLDGIQHVVIQIFGGDNNLTSYVMEDLQEMASGNRGSIAVLALTDFYGEEASVRSIMPGAGLQIVEPLGEIDTGDPAVLATFVARALVTTTDVPHRALGFWDHGSGVFDEHDPNEIYLERRMRSLPRHLRSRSRPARHLFVSPSRLAAHPRLRAMLHDDTNGGVLTNHEAHGVLKAAFDRAGQTGDKIDLIFSDTCLNGMIEVMEQFKEFAHVVIASEDLEPGDGWEYQEWFQRMSDEPPADAAMWGRQAVDAFQAGYAYRPYQFPCTLAAFNTDNDLTAQMKSLIDLLAHYEKEGMKWIKLAIADTQSFARHDSFDIVDFVRRLKETSTETDVANTCNQVMASFETACVHSVALGDQVTNAHGLAFWYPTTGYAFQDVVETYRKLIFDQKTGWSAFLEKYRFGA